MYAIGIDLGSSSVKISVVSSDTGESMISAQHPETEMPIIAIQKSWAEQEPEMWWKAVLKCFEKIAAVDSTYLSNVQFIGIAYQMHGLVAVDKNQEVVRPAIIWCDSRAVEFGEKSFENLGAEYCLNHMLNSPGNFTASKLKWVQENEAEKYAQIDKVMLPGDYIGMKLSGIINSSITALSEGVFWDFKEKELARNLMEEYGFDENLIPDYQESFSDFGKIDPNVAEMLGINKNAKISYKAGDQPNNALSLNVLKPGEIAATAGTSGVVYGVVDTLFVDKEQRVNSFAHVNYTTEKQRIGVLLCINGVGISNAWVKKQYGFQDYKEMNAEAAQVIPGSEGLMFFPFGNGAERMLGNKNIDASIEGLNYNIHGKGHFARAVQEGIAYAFAYGMETFKEQGIKFSKIRAGHANMFLSDIFAQTISDLTGVEIELYNTDGSIGAARGALIGAGKVNEKEAFNKLKMIKSFSPLDSEGYSALYEEWKSILNNKINKK